MTRMSISWALAAVMLTSCAGDRGGAEDPTAAGAATELPSPTPRLTLRSEKPAPPTSLPGDLTGTLGLAEIETGCPYLESADGTRYEVMYPEGWELRRGPLQLIAPDGSTVARAGDEVTVHGSVAGDMASICQIGPIFRATDVVVDR